MSAAKPGFRDDWAIHELAEKRRRLVGRGWYEEAPESEWATPRDSVLRAFQPVGHMMIATFVRKKSAIRIAIEITTTVRVVLLPTPAVPPVVVMPK